MTDREYILGFKSNKESVISVFYKEYKRPFFSFFREKFGKDDDYLVDLFQDSCVILWQNIHDGKLSVDNITSSLQTYLFSIGKYSLMARDRKFRDLKSDKDIEKLQFLEDDVEDLQFRLEKEAFVERMIQDLKPPCSDILHAFYWDRLSCEQIAAKYGYSSADSVKTQKFKCVAKLKGIAEKFKKY